MGINAITGEVNNLQTQNITDKGVINTQKNNEKEYVQDYSAIVEISKLGYDKYTNSLSDEKKKEMLYSEQPNEGYKTIENLIDAVKNGEKLTDEELERLKDSIQNQTIMKYEDMCNLHLAADDERVLKEMKNNYLMKQRSLQKMEEEIQNEKLESRLKEQDMKTTMNAHEIADQKSKVEMLETTLRNITDVGTDAMQNSSNKKQVEDPSQKDDTTDVNISTEDQTKKHVLKEAISIVQGNKENMESVQESKKQENYEEKIYSDMLDETYERTKNIFDKDAFSIVDKVNAFESFMESAEELAINREIARNKKMFDHRTIVDAKILSFSNQSIRNAQEKVNNQNKTENKNVITRNIQKYLLQNIQEEIDNIEEHKKIREKKIYEQMERKKEEDNDNGINKKL